MQDVAWTSPAEARRYRDFAFRPLRWAVYRQLRLMAGRVKRALLPRRSSKMPLCR